MWTRIYRLKAKRNVDLLNDRIMEMCGEVGWLQGKHVILASTSSASGVIRLRFFEHKDFCGCDLKANPDQPIKQLLKWIRRNCR